jgi:hypothetical protein
MIGASNVQNEARRMVECSSMQGAILLGREAPLSILWLEVEEMKEPFYNRRFPYII